MLDYSLIWALMGQEEPTNMSDVENISRMRNNVAYGGAENSLISWTLSNEWTQPSSKEPCPIEVAGEINDDT